MTTTQVRPRPAPESAPWTIDGQPLSDSELRERIGYALESLDTELGVETNDEIELGSFAGAELALDKAIDRIGEAIEVQRKVARVRDLVAEMTRINELQRELRDASLAHRSRALGRVHAALARLRDVPTVDRILEAIPVEVTTLGLPRVILSRVHDSYWMPEVVVIDGQPEWAAEIRAAGREQPQKLDHMILETEMVRRRMPMLVRDVQGDPNVHKPIAAASLSRSYVAAPLMPEGRVVGFIHADCYTTPRHVDEFDRDLLWAFAEGAGYAFARIQALERLHNLRRKVSQLTSAISESVDGAIGAEVEIARIEREAEATTRTTAAHLMTPDNRLASLLTRREVEIAKQMAAGHTNAEIARRLVITEGTVKTHVSHILRKVHATNRAQAVSKLLKLNG